MKSFLGSLRSVFTKAAAGVALAASLVLGAAPAANADVMNRGPAQLVLSQLEADGYQPVAAGYMQIGSGSRVTVTIFKDADNDWMMVGGRGATMNVLERGTDLRVSTWSYAVSTSGQGSAAQPSAPMLVPVDHGGESCAPFATVAQNIAQNGLDNAQLIEGTLADGQTMRIFVKDTQWVSFKTRSDADATTCYNSSGYGFRTNPQGPVIAMK